MMSEISEKLRSLSHDEFLDYYTAILDMRLKTYFMKLSQEADEYHPFIGTVSDHAGEFILRKGKRIASCSTLLAYYGYTDRVDEKILRVCTAIEFYRHSILIHDDLIDSDDLRRGGKAFHRLFSNEYDDSFGEGTAVFYGNVLFSEAIATLVETGFEKGFLFDVVRLLAKGFWEVNESQILDLLFEYKKPSVEDWEAMASKRAASLFKVTMMTGAILGEAPEHEFRLIEDAATQIGYSFDIQDDIIGTFASEEQYGRPPGGDIVRGKKPLHIVYAYQLTEKGERFELERILTAKKVEMGDIERAREIIKTCGALKKAKTRSRDHAKKAIDILCETSMNSSTKRFFTGLIDYVSESLDWYK